MHTLLLDRTRWDLVLDSSKNIAVASDPYSQVQDAASAIRLFRGEAWYNTRIGVPYFEAVLGKFPSAAFLRAIFVKAALSVPGVVGASALLGDIKNRRLGGQVTVKTDTGATATSGF